MTAWPQRPSKLHGDWSGGGRGEHCARLGGANEASTGCGLATPQCVRGDTTRLPCPASLQPVGTPFAHPDVPPLSPKRLLARALVRLSRFVRTDRGDADATQPPGMSRVPIGAQRPRRVAPCSELLG